MSTILGKEHRSGSLNPLYGYVTEQGIRYFAYKGEALKAARKRADETCQDVFVEAFHITSRLRPRQLAVAFLNDGNWLVKRVDCKVVRTRFKPCANLCCGHTLHIKSMSEICEGCGAA